MLPPRSFAVTRSELLANAEPAEQSATDSEAAEIQRRFTNAADTE